MPPYLAYALQDLNDLSQKANVEDWQGEFDIAKVPIAALQLSSACFAVLTIARSPHASVIWTASLYRTTHSGGNGPRRCIVNVFAYELHNTLLDDVLWRAE